MQSFKKIFQKNKQLVENFISLYILNGLDLILPLISLPYLLKVIGPANYGIYAFVIVIIQYVQLFSSYGFNFSVTKQISQERDNAAKVNELYHAALFSRLLITALLTVVGVPVAWYFFKDQTLYLKMLALGSGLVIGDLLIPVWFFQGIEKMRFLTIINIISKSIFTLLIFIFIQEEADYYKIILFNALGSVIAGLACQFIVYQNFKLKFMIPKKNAIYLQFKEGFAVFGSTLSINFYRNSNIFILGLFVSDTAVGIYATAEKIVKAIQSLISPIAQALYPHFGYKFKKMSLKESLYSLYRLIRFIAIILLIMMILTYLFSPILVNFFGGKKYEEAIPMIQYLSLIIFFGGLNYILGFVGLINLNRQKNFFYFVLVSGSISIANLLLFVHNYGSFAAVWSMILSELILFVFCVFNFIQLNKIKSR